MEGSDEDYVEEEYLDEMEFAKEVLALMKKERAELIKAGLDVDFLIAELEKTIQEAADAKAHLDELNRQMLMSMSESLIGENGASQPSTDKLDMADKGLRKDEDLEEHFRRLMRRAKPFKEDKGNA